MDEAERREWLENVRDVARALKETEAENSRRKKEAQATLDDVVSAAVKAGVPRGDAQRVVLTA